mgnify:CR=1 FL=1
MQPKKRRHSRSVDGLIQLPITSCFGCASMLYLGFYEFKYNAQKQIYVGDLIFPGQSANNTQVSVTIEFQSESWFILKGGHPVAKGVKKGNKNDVNRWKRDENRPDYHICPNNLNWVWL